MIATDDIEVLLPVPLPDALTARVEYKGPVQAPIVAGQVLGELVIPRHGLKDARIPLVAQTNVETAGFLPRLRTSVDILLRNLSEGTSGN